MDRKERNKIRFRRIYIPFLICLLIILISSFFDIKFESIIKLILVELILIFIMVYGFIFGGLLKKTTPGFIMAWILFIFLILQIIAAIYIFISVIKW